ncbi:MAG: excinuclease ABC subunit UvrC [Bacteroidia bacterium]|nr:excinuclease ABC subunit UvrC [Bacteroidia bacterium]
MKTILQGLPSNPGVYQFFDKEKRLIYVGKAKNLKKRVSSYFNRDKYDSGKTAVLVKQIRDVKFMIVETELDALLLENNLIKKHQPKYNVQLKDDKTFPWICIKNERFPRVFSTRKKIDDGSHYFGPYASVKMINTLLDLIGNIYKLRNCNYVLSEENIEAGKYKVCLEYHIGNCFGPCEGLQEEEPYQSNIEEIREILKGNIQSVIDHLDTSMKRSAEEYRFEDAEYIRKKVAILERFKSRSLIVHPTIHNVDVFSIANDQNSAYVNYLKINNGSIVHTRTLELKKKLDESEEELLGLAIAELRTQFSSESKEIIVPFVPDIELEGVQFTIPKIGDKRKLLFLSSKNAKYYLKEKNAQMDRLNPDHKIDRILNTMMKDLRLKELPRHIECFDNSNFQGAEPVAAVSVFRNAKPSKKEYRHFNIKTVDGPDDFASMEEIVQRRYSRLLREERSLPQLIIIDGGKGQLRAALNSLERLGLRGKISIIGIAKKLEEIYYPGDSVPLYLDKKGETLKIIQHLRDEVHRFAITHHRNRLQKATIKTELEEIQGIGAKLSNKLLKDFRSVKGIKNATLEELQNAIGKSKGEVVFKHFNKAQ